MQQNSQSKQKQKSYYDRNAKPLVPLETGDSARMQTQMGTWKPGVIINKTNDRSFTLKTNDGSEYRRSRRHFQTRGP